VAHAGFEIVQYGRGHLNSATSNSTLRRPLSWNFGPHAKQDGLADEFDEGRPKGSPATAVSLNIVSGRVVAITTEPLPSEWIPQVIKLSRAVFVFDSISEIKVSN
jgi:hypothetical protein